MTDEKHRVYKSIDFSHHLSDLAKRRVASPIKSLQKYSKPGNIEFGGGKLSRSPREPRQSLSAAQEYLSDRSRTGPHCGVRGIVTIS